MFFKNYTFNSNFILHNFCSYFNSPKLGKDMIEECVDRMCVSLMDALRHKAPEQRLSLEFQHDAYKYLFRGKGRTAEEKNWNSFYENDFCTCRLSTNNWNSIYDQHEDGVKITFPLKLRIFFQLSPRTYKRVGQTIVEAQRAIIEKVSIKFIQVPSSCG